MHTGKVLIAGDPEVIDCESCGFAHIVPYPTRQEIETYYSQDEFYKAYAPDFWLHKERIEHTLHLWDVAYAFQMSLLTPDLPVLDIGAGTGGFVDFAGQYVQALGVEPACSARAAHPRLYASLEEVKPYLKGDWNLRLSLVLEHLPYPRDFLRELVPYLGRRGRLLIIVPNEFNLLQKIHASTHYVQKVHVNYFTRASLLRLCASLSLEPTFEGASFPTEVFLLAGCDFVRDPHLGTRLHIARLHFEREVGRIAFEMYAHLHRMYGIGRELIYAFVYQGVS